VDSAEGDTLCVSHPKIASEADARTKLDALGLLTSNSVQIEFWPWAFGPSEADPYRVK
jgi:hypothetical protein